MIKLLICDDEIKIRETLYDYFTAKGFCAVTAENGRVAVEKAEEESFDLIILDVMMPVMDGLTALREIRKFTDTPVLFLSALGEEEDLLKGYRYGADDYIVKPFPLSVLKEKITATVNRHKGINPSNRLSCSGITLDYGTRKVFCGEREIYLPAKDFAILALLMENKGNILSRETILFKVWGYDFDGDERVVDTHIKRLRKALREYASPVTTVIGAGYCFKKEEKNE